MMELRYKKADISDLDSIRDLIKNAIRKMESRGIYQWDDEYPDIPTLTKDIINGDMTIVCLEDEIVAIYVTNIEYDKEYYDAKWQLPNARFLIVHRLCVNPKFQNRGIARIIIKHIEEEARQDGFESIRLDTFMGNPYSLRLYKSLDYKETGRFFWRKGCLVIMEKVLTVQKDENTTQKNENTTQKDKNTTRKDENTTQKNENITRKDENTTRKM